jgi:hypothetical protein
VKWITSPSGKISKSLDISIVCTQRMWKKGHVIFLVTCGIPNGRTTQKTIDISSKH